jgi:hypothetical protein
MSGQLSATMKSRHVDADNQDVNRCGPCGAALAADAAWCGQCFAQVPQRPAPGTPYDGFVPGASLPDQPVPMRTTRWGKTPTTFGPVGRILATIGLLIPLAVMTGGGFALIFSWGGSLVYAVVILPWGMRDVWQAGRVPAKPDSRLVSPT